MSPRGPRFLDESDERVIAPPEDAALNSPESPPDISPPPMRPVLLDAAPDAPAWIDVGWMPTVVETPRRPVGTGFWVASGLATLVVAWVGLSLVGFVLTLFQMSLGLGGLALFAVIAGLAMIAYAVALELRSYRSLGQVEQLRSVLQAGEGGIDRARAHAASWLRQVGESVPEQAATERMLEAAATMSEVRGVVRSQIADRLRDRARDVGRRAAVEGATLVAICPHPAWDGVIAAARALLVVRRVAALYGLRPGLAVTFTLLRRVAWTAAGTTGISLVSQSLADHALSNTPVVKHLAGALPGTSAVAIRLYRLAYVTAETCSPVQR